MPAITEKEKETVKAILKREYLKIYGYRLKSKKLEEKVDKEIEKAIREYESI